MWLYFARYKLVDRNEKYYVQMSRKLRDIFSDAAHPVLLPLFGELIMSLPLWSDILLLLIY